MDLGVVGAGYVGLVTAACLAKVGHRVTCVDIDAGRVARLRNGDLPLIEPDLQPLVVDGLASGRLQFTSDPADLRGLSLAIVAVGTLDAQDRWTIDPVRGAVRGIVADPAAPRSIAIRSTLIPGTAARLAAEMTEMDPTVELAVNPEFTREGSAVADFMAPDRVVIGTTDPASRIAAELHRVYAPLDATILVTDTTSAETIKVAANVFLASKITFANELARICQASGAQVSAVLEGIGMDPRIGPAFLMPGPGYGGSCLPAQARQLPQVAAESGVTVPLMAAIAASNDRQSEWLLDLAEGAMGRTLDGLHVAVLGLTFKAGTDDLRESPALRIATGLARRGARISVHDPVATARGTTELAEQGIEVVPARSTADACRGADLVLVATEWADYADLDWVAIRGSMVGDLIVDARAVVDVDRATRAGMRVIGLLRPGIREAVRGDAPHGKDAATGGPDTADRRSGTQSMRAHAIDGAATGSRRS